MPEGRFIAFYSTHRETCAGPSIDCTCGGEIVEVEVLIERRQGEETADMFRRAIARAWDMVNV